jgi:hypothetical protein
MCEVSDGMKSITVPVRVTQESTFDVFKTEADSTDITKAITGIDTNVATNVINMLGTAGEKAVGKSSFVK